MRQILKVERRDVCAGALSVYAAEGANIQSKTQSGFTDGNSQQSFSGMTARILCDTGYHKMGSRLKYLAPISPRFLRNALWGLMARIVIDWVLPCFLCQHICKDSGI